MHLLSKDELANKAEVKENGYDFKLLVSQTVMFLVFWDAFTLKN